MATRTIFHNRPDFDPDQTFSNAINEGLSAADQTAISYGSSLGNFVTFTGTVDVAPAGTAIGTVTGGTIVAGRHRSRRLARFGRLILCDGVMAKRVRCAGSGDARGATRAESALAGIWLFGRHRPDAVGEGPGPAFFN